MGAPRTVDDFEKLLAAEGMPADLGGTDPVARIRRVPMQPVESLAGLDDTSLWDQQLLLADPGTRRTGRTEANMARARELLWSGTLSAQQFQVWAMYCDGGSEALIARALRRSREWVRDHYLGAFKTMCGIPTQPFKPRTRVNARKRSKKPGVIARPRRS